MCMRKITGIKAISFDADGTLWDYDKAMRTSLRETLKELEKYSKKAALKLDIEKMIKIRDDVAKSNKGVDLEKVRFMAFRETLRSAGRPDNKLAGHLCEFYLRRRQLNTKPYGDVLPIINALKGKYVLGIVSNGYTSLEQVGLKDLFSFIIFSKDCGIEKPEPLIFGIAVSRAACRNSEFLHVGDSLSDDIRGAKDSGIRCIWLNRTGRKNTTRITPDYEISKLSELEMLL